MNASQLQATLLSPAAPVLLHVLPPEVHEARRIPGSLNACVYETAFLETVSGLIPDKGAAVIVYGAGGDSRDSEVAAGKLAAAGYENVSAFPGGTPEWEAAGFPVEGTGILPADEVPSGHYALDTAGSVIRWTGRNLFNHHSGTVRIAGGGMEVSGGAPVSARFVIDMTSIACEDLTDAGWNAMLIAHLQHADFFDTAHYPSAEFVSERAEPLAGATPGTPNWKLCGQITVRGVTRPLEVVVVVAVAEDGRVTGQAEFPLDRTEFGSLYGSGRFFRFLGKHVVNDVVHLHARLHAVRLLE